MGQLPAIMLSDAAFCGMLRDSNRGPRFELCSSYQDPTIGTWLIRCSFLWAGSLREYVRASRGNAAEADSAPFALDAQVWPCPTVWGPFAARISARILSIQL